MKSYDYTYGLGDLFSKNFFKVITGKSLERALDEAHGDVEDQCRWDAWAIFWKKGWFGKAAKNSISAAADNKKARKRAIRTFWGFKNPISFVAIMMAMILIVPTVAPIARNLVTGGVNGLLSMAGKPANYGALKATIKAFGTAGYNENMVVFDDFVDTDLDGSIAGTKAFLPDGFKSVQEAIDFKKSGDIRAKGIIFLATHFTGCTEEELLDKNNYVLGQFKVKAQYIEMTYYSNGQIYTEATRTAYPDDTFVAFVAPRSQMMVIERAACDNPSLFIPKPLEIIEVTTTSEGTTITVTTLPETTTGEVTTVPETTTEVTEGTTEEETGTTEDTTATTAPATTTTTKPATTTTTTTTYLETKDPEDDVLAKLAKIHDELWKTNGGELLDTSDDPNASNGIQVDPKAAAEALKKAADEALKAANEALKKAIEDAKNDGAGVVDNNQNHTGITKPTNAQGQTDPNYTPFG